MHENKIMVDVYAQWIWIWKWKSHNEANKHIYNDVIATKSHNATRVSLHSLPMVIFYTSDCGSTKIRSN